MGRHDLKVLSSWDECTRCERQEHRLGVLAAGWPASTNVLVIGTSASRTAQACGVFDPALLRFVEVLNARLHLAEGVCVPEVLTACGLGDVLPDHVAACSARFATQTAEPLAVVYYDGHAERLAARAGLLEGGDWAPLGAARIQVIRFTDIENLLAQLGRLLWHAAVAPVPAYRAQLSDEAPLLYAALGAHHGRARRGLSAPNWTRQRGHGLRVADVKAHLAGDVFVAPFHPRGPWPFVVVDVDRHSALQEKYFEETCRKVRELFPHAFEITSSTSQGRHFYVRLPPDVTYEVAAVFVKARLAIAKLMWFDDGRVRAELCEVPEQPVRLPFGLGSSIPGSKELLQKQLQRFLRFVKTGSTADFVAAKQLVATSLKLRGPISIEHRNKVRRFLLDDELRDVRPIDLPVGDPWWPLIRFLSPSLRKVVSGGVPAFGTRTRWTIALVKALANLVGPDEARVLMLHWLRERAHQSEDATMNRDAAEEHTLRVLGDEYKNAGVPKRFWLQVQNSLDSFFRARRENNMFWPSIAERLNAPDEVPSAMRRTAFLILKKFYEKGTTKRYIGAREFAEGVGKNLGRDVERALTDGTWISLIRPYDRGRHARYYELSPILWPPRPGEERVYAYPEASLAPLVL
jgi:hypothetical protein